VWIIDSGCASCIGIVRRSWVFSMLAVVLHFTALYWSGCTGGDAISFLNMKRARHDLEKS
jgi:hypothetical protein